MGSLSAFSDDVVNRRRCLERYSFSSAIRDMDKSASDAKQFLAGFQGFGLLIVWIWDLAFAEEE